MNWSWSKIFEFCCPRRLFLSEGTALPRHHFQKQNSVFNLIQMHDENPFRDGQPTSFCSPGNVGNVECQIPARKNLHCFSVCF